MAFNSAVGSTVSLVGYYPSQSGWQAFAVIMLVVAITAMAQQSALISTSCQLGAGTFDELCQPLPIWSSRVTVASFLVYYWGCLGFYAQFVEAEARSCDSEAPPSLRAAPFVCRFSWPTSFAISCAKGEAPGSAKANIVLVSLFSFS